MLANSTPQHNGADRAEAAHDVRNRAAQAARQRPAAATTANGEERNHGPIYPANFTKGLRHDDYGLVADPADYAQFVQAINADDNGKFDVAVTTAKDTGAPSTVTRAAPHEDASDAEPTWRGWESPRAGHAFDTQGPDADAVGMAPAPRIASSEAAAEIAEVYAMALLRDVPFTEFTAATPTTITGSSVPLTPTDLASALDAMPFFSGGAPRSSTPSNAGADGFNGFERARRAARTGAVDAPLTTDLLFRGSTPGCRVGPYISQFLLAGNDSRRRSGGGRPSFPGTAAVFDSEDGFINFGTQIIDQRVVVAAPGIDYMTDWASWLEVQRGWNFGGLDQFEDKRRFITTPRDLATYVHFDALYQAYLNACLLLLGAGHPTDAGMPEPNARGTRAAFATFGGPHILSLVTEIATRCLKAVRREKFNFHRRARPEAVGGRLALLAAFAAGVDPDQTEQPLGHTAADYQHLLDELPPTLLAAISDHNDAQNQPGVDRWVASPGTTPAGLTGLAATNYLLPMAFPEGSPMHPAYGAGHATVAGGCVTMLKAFFEMFDAAEPGGERVLALGQDDYVEPSVDGKKLVNKSGLRLTVQGELDKLAANIAIGRNMAGVHYYSDYFDSLRMGERVAVGTLLDQLPMYGDRVSMSFTSFDGDHIALSGAAGEVGTLTVRNGDGERVSADDWWLRHV